VLLLCLHFVVKLCSAKTMKKLSASTSAVHPIQTTAAAQPTLQETPSLMEMLRDNPYSSQNEGEDNEKEMEREDEEEGGLGFEFELDEEDEDEEELSHQSLRLDMFVSASASGSSSDSSFGHFAWNQISSLWDSKSESSEGRRPHFDPQLSSRGSGDEESSSEASSDHHNNSSSRSSDEVESS
jgi:hypothetical protein